MRYHSIPCRFIYSLTLAISFFVIPATGQAATQSASTPSANTIELRGLRFDPLAAPANLKNALSMPKDDALRVWVVQFTRPATKAELKLLGADYGLSLQRALPGNAYIERLDGAAIKRVQQLPYFRWAGPYIAEFRLSPQIGKRKFVSERRLAMPDVTLVVVAFPWADLSLLSNAVSNAGFEVLRTIDEQKYGIKRLIVRVGSHDDAKTLSTLDGIEVIEELGDITLNNQTTQWVNQTNLNNSRTIWAQGLQGEQQIIGHIDGVVDMANCFFRDDTDNTIRPSHRKVVGLRNAAAESFNDHGTFSAANAMGEDVNNDAGAAAPNVNNGNAPRARLTHGNLSDLSLAGGSVSFYNYLSQAHGDGAFIHTNSWDDKSTSAYTQLSADLDDFTWDNEMDLVIIGPDNNGTIRPPDSAKNALVVNATQQAPNQGSFSSGITQFSLDGRRKPDLMAPGANIVSADGGTPCGTRTTRGTSFAAPSVAGMAALVRQYYTEGWYPTGTRRPDHAFVPTGALMKATLLNGTVDAANIVGNPDSGGTGEGWGRLLLENSLFFVGDPVNLRVWDVPHSGGLWNSETQSHVFNVATVGQPLRITLVWTEPPAAADSATPVINDLNLRVTDPDGNVYSGNDINTNNGTSNLNGGVLDTLNNVEMVLLPNPVVGEYTIDVIGATVVQGKPFQGYAVVATADALEPPVPVGRQDTLVVRVRFPDADLIGFDPPLPSIQNTMTEVVTYFNEISYNQVDVTPNYFGTVLDLDLQSSLYFPPLSNPVVEMGQEVLAKVLAIDAVALEGDPGDPSDDVERVIIVTNDPDFVGDYATTGAWPYDPLPGLARPISVSIQSYANSVARYAHGLGHQLEMFDLYAHENIVFDFPHANGWDNMAKPINGTHSMVWNKERPGWVTGHGSEITFIPRPGGGASYPGGGDLNPIPIIEQADSGTGRKAIAFGLTEGVTQIQNETAFIFVEARTNGDGNADGNLPGNGVLIYYVNENIAQGEGPLWLLDNNSGTDTLSDAAFQVGDSRNIPGPGIDITVLAGTGGADYNIEVSYDPPDTANDPRITKGDTVGGNFKAWLSPDIWVDNQKNGFDEDGGGAPNPNNTDQAVEGELNRLYFRITNEGPGTAYDFDIHARISEPYHTIGDAADFNRFLGQRHIVSLGDDGVYVGFVEWIPDEDGNPHSCAHIDILNTFGDSSLTNNDAQENLREVTSTTASPYTPVEYQFTFKNPYDTARLFYFRVEDIPADWNRSMSQRKALLAAGQRIELSLNIQPPDDEPVCTSQPISVTSWVSSGDTLVPVGGGTASVDMRNRTLIEAETEFFSCREWSTKGKEQTKEPLVNATNTSPRYTRASTLQLFSPVGILKPDQAKECGVIVQKGCTDPIRSFEEIVVRYEDPAGNPVYHSVITDANGCYEDFYVVTEGGAWEVTGEYVGNDCDGPVPSTPQIINIPLPQDGDQDDDGRPDSDEHSSDADGDGLTGPRDSDSDNDGVSDGDEPDGDFDGDGFDNVIDVDSDGDGIPDGDDARPWGDYEPEHKCHELCEPERNYIRYFLLILILGILLLIWLLYYGKARVLTS